ncbi:TcfC E-set like domain-containing protein [Microbulbifer sp. ZKSA006]|uniref:TcfC E-set like domain-containing protein n=1 Tax=Microbulbifer sp. ZKSA006 TaxID=3243390 RepID=UPI00403A0BD7
MTKLSRTTTSPALALILCLLITQTKASAAALFLETAEPAGFADIAAPHAVLVDLYYGSRRIGAVTINADINTIQFANLEEVLAILPATKDDALVTERIKRPFVRHAGSICRMNSEEGCGFLTPKDISVIYDEENYRVDVFFSPDLLSVEAASVEKFLPQSSSRFSVVQNFSGTLSGSQNSDALNGYNAALSGNTIVSAGENGIYSSWYLTNNSDNKLSSLYWSRDFRGRAVSAGLIQPQTGFSYFRPQNSFYGFEYRSSQRTRTDIDYQQASPVEVNMPLRGRVEIYRAGRLLHSELMEAGNKLVNTTTLPSGAYEIEIRTLDQSGRQISRSVEFFVKDSQLTAPEEWQWDMQIGMPVELYSDSSIPEYYSEPMAQGSVTRRISPNLGITSSIALSNNQQVTELAGRWVGRYWEFTPSYIASSDGRRGYRWQALIKAKRFTISASLAHMDDALSDADTTDELQLLRSGFQQRTINLQTQLLGGQFSVRHSNKRWSSLDSDSEVAEEYDYWSANNLTTIEYQRTFLSSGRWLGNATLSHSEADGVGFTSLGFRFYLRNHRWQSNASLRSDYSATNSRNHQLALQTKWNDLDLWAPVFEQQFSAESSTDEQYLESRTRFSASSGQLNSAVSYSDRETGNSLNYLASFGSSFVFTQNQFSWGGEISRNSAVIIDIEGSEEEKFAVLVNGNRQGYAIGGESSLINLPAFNTYDIALKPLGAGFYDFREKNQQYTLYPGNVVIADYAITPVIVTTGRLIHNGHGIKDTPLSVAGNKTKTDEYGIFQLDISLERNSQSNLEIKWGNCLMTLALKPSSEDWLNLGTIEQEQAHCQTRVSSGELDA